MSYTRDLNNTDEEAFEIYWQTLFSCQEDENDPLASTSVMIKRFAKMAFLEGAKWKNEQVHFRN